MLTSRSVYFGTMVSFRLSDVKPPHEIKEEISHFFYSQPETELDRLLADTAKFFEEN